MVYLWFAWWLGVWGEGLPETCVFLKKNGMENGLVVCAGIWDWAVGCGMWAGRGLLLLHIPVRFYDLNTDAAGDGVFLMYVVTGYHSILICGLWTSCYGCCSSQRERPRGLFVVIVFIPLHPLHVETQGITAAAAISLHNFPKILSSASDPPHAAPRRHSEVLQSLSHHTAGKKKEKKEILRKSPNCTSRLRPPTPPSPPRAPRRAPPPPSPPSHPTPRPPEVGW